MKLFVWDFHGVLEKDTESGVLKISNKVLANEGYPERFNINEIRNLYGLHWFEYFKYLLPDKSISEHMRLQEKCFIIGSTRESIFSCTKPNDQAIMVLEQIINDGHEQILISNSNNESLPYFLEAAGVTKYFKNNAFAVDAHRDPLRTKEQVLVEFLKGKTYDEVIIIGDSPSDVSLKLVASSLGFKSRSYLYAHPGKSFRDCEADYKIHDLRDIIAPKKLFSVNRFKDFDNLKKINGDWTDMDELSSRFENDDY